MRLAIFSYNYHPEPTGIAVYTTGMARWLTAHGWDVVMHTGIPHYPWWRPHPAYADGRGRVERIDGVEVRRVRHYIPTPPVSGLKRILLDASWLWSTFWDALRCRRRPDVLVLIAPPFLSALLGLVLGLIWRRPVIYHVQDLQVDAAVDLQMLPARLGRWLLWIERLLLRTMDRVTTISPAMKRRIEAKTRLRQPVALFPNWTDTSTIRPHRGPNRFRERWRIPPGETVVLYSGNLGTKQGLDVLLRAFAHLGPRDGLHFVIAGEGPERAGLERLAAQLGIGARVRFIPLAPVEDLAEFLSAADLHCVPQRRAAADLVLPSKLTNILAVGRPLVATAAADTDLARAVVAAGAGLVVPPEEPVALAEAILALCQDPARRAAMGEQARRYAERELSADAILGAFTRLAASVRRPQGQVVPAGARLVLRSAT